MHDKIQQAVTALDAVLAGKRQAVELSLACLLADGHLLIEDLPGMGKTTLANGIARVLGLEFQRVQFTSDLLPADILGVSVFNRDSGEFDFRPGPIFTQVLLADEVNRATPKTQSALLEAMAEQQVSIDGQSRPLPAPFFVIATQNPERHGGTFALPESQLDRFTMRLSLGYPDPAYERAILQGRAGYQYIAQLPQVLQPAELIALQQHVQTAVRVSDSLLDYVQRLLAASRSSPEIGTGLSPRAALALLQCARAWAYVQGRDYVVPEDVQAVFAPVCAHRLRDQAQLLPPGDALASTLLGQVAVIA